MIAVAACAVALAGCAGGTQPPPATETATAWEYDALRELGPADGLAGARLRDVLDARRSVRDLSAEPLTDRQLAALLWSAQGVSAPTGARTAPSAGALYPLEVYAVTRSEVLHYLPGGMPGGMPGGPAGDAGDNAVVQVRTDSTAWQRLTAALGGPTAPKALDAAAVIVVTGVAARSTGKYGERGVRYMWMEAGHATQNLLLAATAMGLGAVPIGAFDDGAVSGVLGLPDGESPLYLVPVGRPAG